MTKTAQTERDLASLIERGGVHYNVPGLNAKELIAAAIDLLPPIPSLDPASLLREILDREALASTGIGKGIALPHPRSPMLGESGGSANAAPPLEAALPLEATPPLEAALPLVAVLFPAQSLDWNTPDGSKVHTLFLIVSSTAKQHLGVLSKITFLSQQEQFYSLIASRAPKDRIIAAIREAENTWTRSVI